MKLRTIIGSCALAAALLAPCTGTADGSVQIGSVQIGSLQIGSAQIGSAQAGSVFGRLISTLRLETSVAMGDTFAQGGLGLWLPVDPARHVRWGIDAFELGFARGVDNVRYRRSPVLLGVRIRVGSIGRH